MPLDPPCRGSPFGLPEVLFPAEDLVQAGPEFKVRIPGLGSALQLGYAPATVTTAAPGLRVLLLVRQPTPQTEVQLAQT